MSRGEIAEPLVRPLPTPWWGGENLHPPTHTYRHRGGGGLDLTNGVDGAADPPTHQGSSRMHSPTSGAPLCRDAEKRTPPPHYIPPRGGTLEKIGPQDMNAIPHRGAPLEIIGPQGADQLNPSPPDESRRGGGRPAPRPFLGWQSQGGGMGSQLWGCHSQA